jgi:hypothetical protein
VSSLLALVCHDDGRERGTAVGPSARGGAVSAAGATFGSGASGAGAWTRRSRGVDLREPANLAGDIHQVVRGVKCLFGGVQIVEYGTDEGGLAHVLGR